MGLCVYSLAARNDLSCALNMGQPLHFFKLGIVRGELLEVQQQHQFDCAIKPLLNVGHLRPYIGDLTGAQAILLDGLIAQTR